MSHWQSLVERRRQLHLVPYPKRPSLVYSTVLVVYKFCIPYSMSMVSLRSLYLPTVILTDAEDSTSLSVVYSSRNRAVL